jgi:hypothetical protein
VRVPCIFLFFKIFVKQARLNAAIVLIFVAFVWRYSSLDSMITNLTDFNICVNVYWLRIREAR